MPPHRNLLTEIPIMTFLCGYGDLRSGGRQVHIVRPRRQTTQRVQGAKYRKSPRGNVLQNKKGRACGTVRPCAVIACSCSCGHTLYRALPGLT